MQIRHFAFVIKEKFVSEITWRSLRYRFGKAPFTLKRKVGVFKFPLFEERFRKNMLSWQISVDGRPNRRNKAAFSWRISVDGRPNRRNKAVFSWRISVEVRSNRRRKAAFSWRISVDRIGLTVETKLRFHISPTQCGPGLKIKILGWKFSINRHYTFFSSLIKKILNMSWCLKLITIRNSKATLR